MLASGDWKEKARERIGGDPWYYTAWFIRLANLDIHNLSEGDLKNLQEECEVIRDLHVPFRPMEQDRKRYPFLRGGPFYGPTTVKQLLSLQKYVLEHLSAIADGEDAKFGPFVIQHETRFTRSSEKEKSGGYPNYRIYRIEILQSSKESNFRDQMLIRLARLLEADVANEPLVERVRRCPHCGKLFLQLRSNATYCGRICHSRAGMKKLRAKKAARRITNAGTGQ